MKKAIQTIIMIALVAFALPAHSNFDTEKYDDEVTNYIFEIYERFNNKVISKADFEKYYRQLVVKPDVTQLGAVIQQIHQAAGKDGNGISHDVFVVSLQKLILGQNPMRLPYGRQMVADLVLQLESDQITQSDMLSNTLKHEMAVERLEEVLTGQIQTERFAHMKVSSNNK